MSSVIPVSYELFDDYAQSANTLFHFMKKPEYLHTILTRRAIIPRYCVEDISYLNIKNKGHQFKEVAILQKCFCDIPFHKLGESFALNAVGKTYESLTTEEKANLERNNTHFDYYGHFAIGFSKKWGELNNLQPIHYLNSESLYAKDFSALFESCLDDDEIKDDYIQDIINRLSYMKPLRGIMKRKIKHQETYIDVEIYKNFHDEREWRYVPDMSKSLQKMESIIANPKIIGFCNQISNNIENEQNSTLWLRFSFNDIRYIIVPDSYARLEVIKTILEIPNEVFDISDNILQQKHILISKILVLNEIRKDW